MSDSEHKEDRVILVLRKDVREMRRKLKETFDCLVRLDQEMSQKLNGAQYRNYSIALDDMDTVFRRIEFYEQNGGSFVRKEVKDED